MRRLLAGLFLLGASFSWASAQPALELVESFPSETDFDQTDIRDTLPVWLELIEQADRELLWHTFYLAHRENTPTQPVLDALERAAARGVSVRLLVDEKFRETYPDTLLWLHGLDNVVVRSSPVGRWLGGVMHAKIMLVDGQAGFLGSQNFDWRSLEHIRELGVVFRDPALVEFYRSVFEWEWENHETTGPPATLPAGQSAVFELDGHRVVPTVSPNPLNSDPELGDEAQILKLLGEAEESMEIALLSYSPVTREGNQFYPDLDNAIRSAAVRGVEVRLLLSHWVEKKGSVDHVASLDALDNVEVKICRIPLTAEGEIPFARVHHSKYLVVDGSKAWLGTSNWSKGYFHQSRNYGLVFESGPLPARLSRLFQFDWARSTGLRSGSEKKV